LTVRRRSVLRDLRVESRRAKRSLKMWVVAPPNEGPRSGRLVPGSYRSRVNSVAEPPSLDDSVDPHEWGSAEERQRAGRQQSGDWPKTAIWEEARPKNPPSLATLASPPVRADPLCRSGPWGAQEGMRRLPGPCSRQAGHEQSPAARFGNVVALTKNDTSLDHLAP
jgi:hypothetical protein